MQILKSPEIVAQVISNSIDNNPNNAERLSDIQIIKALKDTSKVWDELFFIEQVRITRMFIRKAILKPEGLDIQIYNERLNLLTAELMSDVNTTKIIDKTKAA